VAAEARPVRRLDPESRRAADADLGDAVLEEDRNPARADSLREHVVELGARHLPRPVGAVPELLCEVELAALVAAEEYGTGLHLVALGLHEVEQLRVVQ